MKIYREGREIYEIKDYKQVGKFMEVATIEATIKSTLPIDIKVGDYVIFDYNNLKYTLYDVYPAKKQARSSTYGEAYVYDLKFKADTEQLSICPFLDLVPNDNNLTYSSLPSFSTFENVYGIADRLQANLDYLYPNQWRFDVVETTDAELLETLSDAREFAISGESCLEGLRKIYDIWGVGFIHSVEDGVNIITIGKSAGKTSLFRYGKGRGLRTIKKNLQNSDQLCTRAYVFGSTRNIPARWYNNKGYIGEAQYAPNLMIPPSKWVDGIPQGAYIDAIFDGENRIEKYGLKIKTFSYDGSDSNKTEIYPSIEKMTAKIIRDAKAEIGENTYIPSPTLYPDNERMDMVLEGSNIADDGTNSEPGYVLHSDKIIKSIEGESETITIAEKKGESKYEVDDQALNINICTFDIEKPANYRIRERLDFVTFKKNDLESTISAILTLQTPSGEYIELRKLAFTDKLEDSLQIPDSTHELKEAGKYTLILKLGVSWTTNWVVPQIGEDVYLTYNIAETDITLSRGEKILDNFFTIKIKQIGFDINDYTASSGAFKNIHFRSGMCSGMSFNIAKCSYIEEIDAWELKCRRVEDSSISQRFPNSIFNIAKDDRFVLLDINMPDLYIYTNMQRLYDTALEDLKHFSTPQYVIEPQIDNIQMARSPQVLKEGMYMAIDDLDISIFNEEALIDSVTITNKGTDLRSFEVTLRNDKVYNRYNKLADRIAELESAAQKTASNSTITPVQDSSESKVETPAVGFDENALADYLEKNKYTTEGDVTNLLSPIDKEVSTLRTDFDNLNTLLNGNVGGVIDSWNEVVAFLDGYSQSDDLAAILSGMNEDISNRVLTTDFEKANDSIKDLLSYFDATGNANNALKLGGHSAEYFATATAVNTLTTNLNSLTLRVSTNEQGITTNKNNIATLVEQVNGLADDVEILKGYWYIDNNGNLHTTHNIVVEGGGAFGKGSGGGGDVPSGGGIDETQLWNILGTSGTQTIHSSHIPDLSGKYLPLSGGTISSATIPLSINRTNGGFSLISYKCDGVQVGNLGFNQNGDLVVRSQFQTNTNYYNIYHSGNFNPADYLPLTGGKISSGAFSPLTIKGNNSYAGIGFQKTGDSEPSYLVYINEWDWRITNANWADSKKILHSGNYSSYALPLSGGTIKNGSVRNPLSIDTTDSTGAYLVMKANGASKAYFGYDSSLGALIQDNSSSSTVLYIRDGHGYIGNQNKWNTLIHSGNIGEQKVERAKYIETLAADGASWYGDSYRIYGQWASETTLDWKVTGYEVRVDKAKKLNTARTIWGQSFDGTGNIEVTTIGRMRYLAFTNADGSGNIGYIGRGSNTVNTVYLSSYDNPLSVTTNNGGIYINNNGNVLIGTTTDSGYKLAVNGTLNATTIYQNGTAIGSLAFKNSLVASDIPSLDWSKITSGKPTTLAGYGITDALPLTGGTISGSGLAFPLIIKGTAAQVGIIFKDIEGTNKAAISWESGAGTYIFNYPSGKYISIKDDGTPTYSGGNTLLHSGNYSSYALPLSGGTLTNSLAVSAGTISSTRTSTRRAVFYKNASNTVDNGTYIVDVSDSGDARLKLTYDNLTWKDNTVIHSGNIGSQSVASANKLLTSNGASMVYQTSAGHLYVGDNIYTSGDTHILGNNVRLRYGTSASYGLILNSSGNVTIGASDLASTTTKLYVDGGIRFAPRTIWGKSFDGTQNVSGNLSIERSKIYWNTDINNYYIGWNSSEYAFDFVNYYGHRFHSGGSERMRITTGGNVLIGTTTDNGAKLQVNGKAQSGGYTLSNSADYYCGLMPNSVITSGGTATDIWLYNSTKILIYGSSIQLQANTNIAGNLTVTGGGAFGSDVRYKDITSYRQLDLETIVNAPLFTFRWTDREDKVEHLGTSAQYWLGTQAKDAVNTANKDFYHLDYGALGVGIGISVAREVKGVKNRVELLEEEVKQLKQELAQYRRV